MTGTPEADENAVRNSAFYWLHNQHFSVVAYVIASAVGAYGGVAGVLAVLEISQSGLTVELLAMPLVAFAMYMKIVEYLLLTLTLSAIAMMPLTYFLLKSTSNWRSNNIVKYALLGMPVAALYAVGQMSFWSDELGGVLNEAPIGTVAAIILGGAVGGLSYLGVAAIFRLSNPREDPAT